MRFFYIQLLPRAEIENMFGVAEVVVTKSKDQLLFFPRNKNYERFLLEDLDGLVFPFDETKMVPRKFRKFRVFYSRLKVEAIKDKLINLGHDVNIIHRLKKGEKILDY